MMFRGECFFKLSGGYISKKTRDHGRKGEKPCWKDSNDQTPIVKSDWVFFFFFCLLQEQKLVKPN